MDCVVFAFSGDVGELAEKVKNSPARPVHPTESCANSSLLLQFLFFFPFCIFFYFVFPSASNSFGKRQLKGAICNEVLTLYIVQRERERDEEEKISFMSVVIGTLIILFCC